jgi:hypothetical protein
VEAALIRPLFRLLCWLAAEHRGLLLDASPVARDRFVNRDTAPESPGAPESPEVPGEDLFAMVRSLGLDYGQLGAAELGAAYTALLDGHERKATGSYYTPPELVERLLDSALEPVLDQTQDRPGALLAVTVCDPACGAGHFLVAAARRIARRLPRPGALRDVIRHCIYGVDVNPVAVELTKIALWLEAAEPGQPFGCLEARIRHGNSLIGAISGTPATGTREAADAWCATLVQPQESRPFFHWPLEFPGVFRAGGFSCVVGNPPWERIKLSRRPEGESRFLRGSGRYPLTARGDLNAYAVFAEAGRMLTGPRGRLGLIVPTGIATDLGTQGFFRNVAETGALASLYDFGNARGLFPDVHRSYRFSLLTLAGRPVGEPAADFAFSLREAAELDGPGRRFTLTPGEITRLNPGTGTCPLFRTRRDAEITLGIYRRVPVLVDGNDPGGNPWGVSFTRMLDMSLDAGEFHTREQLERDGWLLVGNVFHRGQARMLPLYQGIMASFYDHRAADVVRSKTAGRRQYQPRYLTTAEKQDPARTAMPLFWVAAAWADARHASGLPGWLLGFSSVTSPTNERTFVPYLLPRAAVGNSTPLIRAGLAAAGEVPALVAMLSAFCFDYAVRQKVGGVNLNYFIVRQLPVLPPQAVGPFAAFCADRVLELSYTAHDLAPFARSLGDEGPPFRWDTERRFAIRAELDALFFRLYGIGRADADYIMDTFTGVRKADLARHGRYRTKEAILACYDRMALDRFPGYQTAITPRPGQGPRHAPAPPEAGR